jgi:hypothetical protein
MSSPLQEKAKFQAISSCFLKLVALKTYQNQWQTNEQWASIVWALYQDILTPILEENEELDGKLLDMCLKKDKAFKNNLQNYTLGTSRESSVKEISDEKSNINQPEPDPWDDERM